MAEPRVVLQEKDLTAAASIDADVYGGAVIYSNRGPTTPTLYSSARRFSEQFGNPDPTNSADRRGKLNVLAFLEAAPCWVTRVINGALYGGVTIEDSVGGGSAALGVGVSSPDSYAFGSGSDVTMLIVGANPGEWNDNIRVTISDVSGSDFKISVDYYSNGSWSTISGEVWECSKSQTAKDGYGRSKYVEDVINGKSEYIYVVDNTENTNAPEEVTSLQFGGGDDGSSPTVSDYQTAISTMRDTVVDIDIWFTAGQLVSSESQSSFINSMANAAKEHYGIVVADLDDDSRADAITTVDGWSIAERSYVSVVYPWLKVTDALNDSTVEIPASGYAAARYADVEISGNVWDPHAGVPNGQISGALDLSQALSTTDRGLLTAANINPFKIISGSGIVLWDQNTLQSSTGALKFVTIRRTMSSIEKDAYSFLVQFIHQNNTEFTRLRIERGLTNLVDSNYKNVPGGGGVKNFRVVCDSSNNTSVTIAQGILYADMYVTPVYPAREIYYRVFITDEDVYVTQG